MLSAIATTLVCLFFLILLAIVPKQGPMNGIQNLITTISGLSFFILLPILNQLNGLTEFTTSCLSPGVYQAKVEIEGISEDYNILDPDDYATSKNALSDEILFVIKPLVEVKAHILSPQDYKTYIYGDTITLNGLATTFLNNTLCKEITSLNVEEFN